MSCALRTGLSLWDTTRSRPGVVACVHSLAAAWPQFVAFGLGPAPPAVPGVPVPLSGCGLIWLSLTVPLCSRVRGGGQNLRVPPRFVPCRAVPPWGGRGGGKEALCRHATICGALCAVGGGGEGGVGNLRVPPRFVPYHAAPPWGGGGAKRPCATERLLHCARRARAFVELHVDPAQPYGTIAFLQAPLAPVWRVPADAPARVHLLWVKSR